MQHTKGGRVGRREELPYLGGETRPEQCEDMLGETTPKFIE